MAENLAPPRQFNTGAADQYTEWKTWIDAFDIYAMALELEKKSNDVQLATMLHCLGRRSREFSAHFLEKKVI